MGSSRKLAELAGVVQGDVVGDSQVVVRDVTHDSRQVGPGSLFVAILGETFDGHDFVDQAVAAGATAICVQRRQSGGVPQLVVGDTREVLGQLADEVHGHPSRALDVLGVTGTNGKTTVTYYIESLLRHAGFKTGLIGTVATRIGPEELTSIRTTPEASDFQRTLASMRESGVEKAAVEVSSHALDLRRVDATHFAVAAFTNLSQDHLDFHGSMDAYRAAKRRLFTDFSIGTAVFNIDDAMGRTLADEFAGPSVTVGRAGDFSALSVVATESGSRFTLVTPRGAFDVEAPVIGRFNVDNLLIALAASAATGPGVEELVPHLSKLDPVPGRFEIVSDPEDPTVVVDYAHTPDGIASAVATGRQFSGGRVIVVFGAGGDRDRAKRPMMGEAASAADIVVVTSDNPRSEDPEKIIEDVLSGVSTGAIRESDRRSAISEAIRVATPDDIVLILGKGHETGQEIAGTVTPFDDRVVAREVLKLWRKSANFEPDSGSMGT